MSNNASRGTSFRGLNGLLLALGLTVVISARIEVVRRVWAWRRRRAERSQRPSSAVGGLPPGASPAAGEPPQATAHER